MDANGRFDLETAIAYAKMLRDYPLFWYEEAGDPLDYQLQAALAEFYPDPMATGENLFSHQDARNLIRYGGMRPDRDWLQFDCALSYGLCEYQRTLQMVKDAGWSWKRCIPHGGHQMSLAIAAGLGLGGNESYPDVFQPYGGFPDGTRVEDSHRHVTGTARHRVRGEVRPFRNHARAGGVTQNVRVWRPHPRRCASRPLPRSGRGVELHCTRFVSIKAATRSASCSPPIDCDFSVISRFLDGRPPAQVFKLVCWPATAA